MSEPSGGSDGENSGVVPGGAAMRTIRDHEDLSLPVPMLSRSPRSMKKERGHDHWAHCNVDEGHVFGSSLISALLQRAPDRASGQRGVRLP
eukprot:CAMPEP_0206035830 /NCGR_PEP_ID=MMETSP1466-20131121/2364_1 /ASSEMBLY_ACC=CAM_ASM_001126 /TAXON_ID=44452 /ORGANISM="Pavlova gyrans, Strain CCMP608" /LENGTH=90 /DNA_ID=CAMNT_0053410251 /DNA_START=638 /DNA_END=905 /DNA_ORIENTATION=-